MLSCDVTKTLDNLLFWDSQGLLLSNLWYHFPVILTMSVWSLLLKFVALCNTSLNIEKQNLYLGDT